MFIQEEEAMIKRVSNQEPLKRRQLMKKGDLGFLHAGRVLDGRGLLCTT